MLTKFRTRKEGEGGWVCIQYKTVKYNTHKSARVPVYGEEREREREKKRGGEKKRIIIRRRRGNEMK